MGDKLDFNGYDCTFQRLSDVTRMSHRLLRQFFLAYIGLFISVFSNIVVDVQFCCVDFFMHLHNMNTSASISLASAKN